MRQIYEHAEAIHLLHYFLAEAREAAVPRRIRRRVGPVVRLEVSQRHVAHAEPIVGAQRPQ